MKQAVRVHPKYPFFLCLCAFRMDGGSCEGEKSPKSPIVLFRLMVMILNSSNKQVRRPLLHPSRSLRVVKVLASISVSCGSAGVCRCPGDRCMSTPAINCAYSRCPCLPAGHTKRTKTRRPTVNKMFMTYSVPPVPAVRPTYLRGQDLAT